MEVQALLIALLVQQITVKIEPGEATAICWLTKGETFTASHLGENAVAALLGAYKKGLDGGWIDKVDGVYV